MNPEGERVRALFFCPIGSSRLDSSAKGRIITSNDFPAFR